ncbi:hypothetical protein GCM10022223_55800 [Kineosporia mesophila]|uniref:Uncharacterized protein n=1 Tax=Kineosporia mesophila TaxID=566012 RepID=A0ABP7AEU9_9ACTN|nr:hypothetical protein [Kineosporia mesophila]MCD5352882.1 hypothetical protein [Kineosporia mesophila]
MGKNKMRKAVYDRVQGTLRDHDQTWAFDETGRHFFTAEPAPCALAEEPWVENVLLVSDTLWQSAVLDDAIQCGPSEELLLIHAVDGSGYVLGAADDDVDLSLLAERLLYPEGEAPDPFALAEVMAPFGGSKPGQGLGLIEGSAWGTPLLERFPAAGQIAASVHPVRWKREAESVHLEFCSYSYDLTRGGLVVSQWSVQVAAGFPAQIGLHDIALTPHLGPGALSSEARRSASGDPASGW